MSLLYSPRRLTALLVLLVAGLGPETGFLGLAAAGSSGPRPLPRSQPEAQGVSPTAVSQFLDAVAAQKLNLHSLMVVRHGKVVAEGWWAPYAPELRHTLYSLSKSFTSTAVGLAAADGRLRLDDSVISFFPDQLPTPVGPNLAEMKVKHLLMMGAGHSADSLFGAGFSLTNRNQDWVRSVLSRPVDHVPGTHFTYNNGASYLLSAIVQKATGQTVLDFLSPRLFKPLGIEGADWEESPQGINTGGFGLRVKTEDIAKLGQLYLQKGSWRGKRLLPESWVEAATGVQIQNAPPGDANRAQNSDWAQGYGYQFWRCRHGGYRGDGASGQYCIVLPDQDAVIAITAETADMQAVLNAIWSSLLPAFREHPLPSDPTLRAQLATQLRLLMLPTPSGQAESPEATRVSKGVYEFSENPFGIQQASVTFRRNECVFTLRDGQGQHSVRCGLGTWVTGETKLSPAPLHLATTSTFGQTPIAGSAAWSDRNTLVMYWRFIETAHYESVTCRFDGETLQIEIRRSSALLNPNTKEPQPVLTGKLAPRKK